MKPKKFVNKHIYHLFNKSIAGFGIFKDLDNSNRFLQVLDYYNNISSKNSFSYYLKARKDYNVSSLLYLHEKPVVKYLAYCIMPDHYHLLVKIINANLVSKYISDIENSYSRYFNIMFDRKGPLWQSRFKSVQIKSNNQLLHVSRYIHLNPTTACLIDNPKDWIYSSYRQYIKEKKILKNILPEISITSPKAYKKFVEDNKNHQKKIARIKRYIIE